MEAADCQIGGVKYHSAGVGRRVGGGECQTPDGDQGVGAARQKEAAAELVPAAEQAASPRPAAAAKTKIQEETRRATQAQVGVAGRNFRKAEKLTFYFFSPRRGRTRRFRLTSNSRRRALARCQDSLPVGVPRSMDLCNMADFAAGKKRFLRFACVQCPCEARPIPPGSAPG